MNKIACLMIIIAICFLSVSEICNSSDFLNPNQPYFIMLDDSVDNSSDSSDDLEIFTIDTSGMVIENTLF